MKKKKGIGRWIVLAVLAAAAIVLIVFFKQYYDYRYVLDDQYYTVVPMDYDITPHRDNQGYRETTYSLKCYNADGEARALDFDVLIDAHSSHLYPPGTYMVVSASKQLVIGRRAVDRSGVPEKALERIDAGFVLSGAASIAEYAGERTRLLGAANKAFSAVSCVADGDSLVYTYVWAGEDMAGASEAAELLDPVYIAQFRTDKLLFDGIAAIYLEVKMGDGTVVFSQKYDTKVTFDYENE